MKELQTTVTIYKKEGETPLECLERLRAEQPEYKDAVLSYAGRLDPMAEGALLVLVNEANKDREKYLGMDKEYEVDILFGVSTDTGDVLGKLAGKEYFSPDGGLRNLRSSLRRIFVPDALRVAGSYSSSSRRKILFSRKLLKALHTFVRPLKQKYPHYSSRTVEGKPLFQWAREGRISEIEIPEKSSEVYSIELLETYELSAEEVLKQVCERVGKVTGDFRQEEILASWRASLEECPEKVYQLARIVVRCSSGTYMRTLAQSVAQNMGTTAIAWKIKRTLLFSRSKVL